MHGCSETEHQISKSVRLLMIWPFKLSSQKQIARIEINGAIASATRKQVLDALKTVEEKRFPALLLRIDSPGGTVGDSQEIYSALKRLGEKIKIVATVRDSTLKMESIL